MLDSAMPCYQAGLGNMIMEKLLNSTGQAATLDEINDIALEYEIITQPDIASRIPTEYKNMAVSKSDTTWNWSCNMPCKSL